jgi:hypothetical protein
MERIQVSSPILAKGGLKLAETEQRTYGQSSLRETWLSLGSQASFEDVMAYLWYNGPTT